MASCCRGQSALMCHCSKCCCHFANSLSTVIGDEQACGGWCGGISPGSACVTRSSVRLVASGCTDGMPWDSRPGNEPAASWLQRRCAAMWPVRRHPRERGWRGAGAGEQIVAAAGGGTVTTALLGCISSAVAGAIRLVQCDGDERTKHTGRLRTVHRSAADWTTSLHRLATDSNGVDRLSYHVRDCTVVCALSGGVGAQARVGQ